MCGKPYRSLTAVTYKILLKDIPALQPLKAESALTHDVTSEMEKDEKAS